MAFRKPTHTPKPFKRPGITVSTESQDVKKEWRDCTPDEVHVGDIILGKGLVVGGTATEVYFDDDPEAVTVHVFQMKNGTEHRVQNMAPLRAFVKVQGG